MIRGLTLRHPWAWVFRHCDKDVENRLVRPEAWAGRVGMFLALHGGSTPVREYLPEFLGAARQLRFEGLIPEGVATEELVVPGIVAVARLTGVSRDHPSAWAVEGQWHWALEVTRLPVAVPHRGGQRLWELDADKLERVRRLYQEARQAYAANLRPVSSSMLGSVRRLATYRHRPH